MRWKRVGQANVLEELVVGVEKEVEVLEKAEHDEVDAYGNPHDGFSPGRRRVGEDALAGEIIDGRGEENHRNEGNAPGGIEDIAGCGEQRHTITRSADQKEPPGHQEKHDKLCGDEIHSSVPVRFLNKWTSGGTFNISAICSVTCAAPAGLRCSKSTK